MTENKCYLSQSTRCWKCLVLLSCAQVAGVFWYSSPRQLFGYFSRYLLRFPRPSIRRVDIVRATGESACKPQRRASSSVLSSSASCTRRGQRSAAAAGCGRLRCNLFSNWIRCIPGRGARGAWGAGIIPFPLPDTDLFSGNGTRVQILAYVDFPDMGPVPVNWVLM